MPTAGKNVIDGNRKPLVRLASSCAFVAMLVSAPAYADGCAEMHRVARSTDRALVGILSGQVGRPVTVAGSYRQGRWSIYDVIADGEHGFVFFGGPPRRAPKAYVWGGTAQPDEYADIVGEVRRHVPGIPAGLAQCFARRVSGKRG